MICLWILSEENLLISEVVTASAVATPSNIERGIVMTRVYGVRLDDEERDALYKAMKIIGRMYNKTNDPILKDMIESLAPLDSCLSNGSLWTYEV